MLNYEVFSKENQPTEAGIKDFVGAEIFTLFSDLDNHLRDAYKVKPKLAYSSCAMDQNNMARMEQEISEKRQIIVYNLPATRIFFGFGSGTIL